MKIKLIVTVSILVLVGCGSNEKMFPRADKPWEGWAGSPDKPGKMPFEYFYIKSQARASQKSIEMQNENSMKKTCSDAASLMGKADIATKMLSEFSECSDCSDDKKTIFKESNAVKEAKLKECIPTSPEISELKGSNWRECECVIYAHIPGGKDGLHARIRE